MAEAISEKKEDPAGARRQLWVRGVLAVSAIAVLITALVMFEGKQTERAEPAQTTAHMTTPITPAPSLAEQAQESIAQSPDAPQTESASLPNLDAPASAPAGVPEETSDPTAGALGVPSGRLAEPAPRRVDPPARLVLRDEGSATERAGRVAPLPAKPVATPSSNGYFVQVGVFSQYSNAEDLRNRLAQNGIPTQLETRVQVGPFANKQEAVAAQSKLRALGLDGGMVITNKK